MEPWKKAQEDFKKEMNKINRKDFLFKAFTDTYAAGGNIVQDQLSDFWVLDNGKFYVIEVKSCHQAKFYFKDIRPSQLIAARRVPAAGGFSRFILKKLPEGLWFKVDGEVMYNEKQSGAAGMLWSQMTPIKLCWEDIQ